MPPVSVSHASALVTALPPNHKKPGPPKPHGKPPSADFVARKKNVCETVERLCVSLVHSVDINTKTVNQNVKFALLGLIVVKTVHPAVILTSKAGKALIVLLRHGETLVVYNVLLLVLQLVPLFLSVVMLLLMVSLRVLLVLVLRSRGDEEAPRGPRARRAGPGAPLIRCMVYSSILLKVSRPSPAPHSLPARGCVQSDHRDKKGVCVR